MHYYYIENNIGDLVDLIPFCGDFCHHLWCDDNKLEYKGWNGCHETERDEKCASCGNTIKSYLDEDMQL